MCEDLARKSSLAAWKEDPRYLETMTWAVASLTLLSTAGWLGPSSVGLAPSCTSPRSAVRCSADAIPDDVANAIPPERLADAWRREERAKELGEVLKGCSLYLTGTSARKTAVARVLSRRLPRYRFYDVSALMCSTYSAMGGADAEAVGLPQLLAKEPLADVEQLASAVMGQLQQYSRSVFVPWAGSISQKDFMVMQQGLVVNLDSGESTEGVVLPPEDSEEVLAKWREGHARADLTVPLEEGTAADDAASDVIEALLAFIEANPAKSEEWKEKADEALSKGE